MADLQRRIALPFGEVDGAAVHLYELRNAVGAVVRISNYGASVVAVEMPHRDGRLGDVVLGFDSLADYRAHSWYCGATIGRFAGRISHARFSLDGRNHMLSVNAPPHHLHGGIKGFDKVVWQARADDDRSLRLRYISADGEEGYAGTVDAAVTYSLTDDNALVIDYFAHTDRATPINLTHHSYFNLAGHGDILDHELTINADEFVPNDATLTPLGGRRDARGSVFDFRSPHRIGERIDVADPQLRVAGGYDHDFPLRKETAEVAGARFAARAHDPVSGRVLEVFTTQPALRFYSGNFIASEPAGKGGVRYGPHSGFALEAQHFADSPNHPDFPASIVRPGTPYRERTIYRFSVAGAA